MLTYLKEHIEYFKDFVLVGLSWFSYKIILLSSLLIDKHVNYKEVKEIIELVQPILGLITTFLVLLTVVIRYKQTKNKKDDN